MDSFIGKKIHLYDCSPSFDELSKIMDTNSDDHLHGFKFHNLAPTLVQILRAYLEKVPLSQ